MRPLFVATVVILLSGLASNASARIEPAARTAEVSAPTQVSIEIDISPLLKFQDEETATFTGVFVREDVEKALAEKYGFEVVKSDDAPAIVIRVSWVDYMKSIYQVEMGIRRPGEAAVILKTFVPDAPEDIALARVIAGSLDEPVAELRRSPSDEPDEGPESLPPTDPQEPDPKVIGATEDDGPTSPPRRPLGAFGKTGIALLVSGAVGMGVGGAVLAQGHKFSDTGDVPYTQDGLNYRPPGIAILVSGGALAVVGVALIVVDRRRELSPTQARRFQIAPTRGGMALRF